MGGETSNELGYLLEADSGDTVICESEEEAKSILEDIRTLLNDNTIGANIYALSGVTRVD